MFSVPSVTRKFIVHYGGEGARYALYVRDTSGAVVDFLRAPW